MGRTRYGLSNVHIAVYDETAGTYGSWIAIPGAVSLTSDSEANSTDFYADNVVYDVISVSSRETGTIEFAALENDIFKTLLGWADDSTSGLTYLDTEPKNITVALGYEVSGNQGKLRGLRYNVKFSEPSDNANTVTESTDPDTISLDFTAIGRDFTIGSGTSAVTKNVLKARVEEDAESDAWTNFFKKVLIPGVSSAS